MTAFDTSLASAPTASKPGRVGPSSPRSPSAPAATASASDRAARERTIAPVPPSRAGGRAPSGHVLTAAALRHARIRHRGVRAGFDGGRGHSRARLWETRGHARLCGLPRLGLQQRHRPFAPRQGAGVLYLPPCLALASALRPNGFFTDVGCSGAGADTGGWMPSCAVRGATDDAARCRLAGEAVEHHGARAEWRNRRARRRGRSCDSPCLAPA